MSPLLVVFLMAAGWVALIAGLVLGSVPLLICAIICLVGALIRSC